MDFLCPACNLLMVDDGEFAGRTAMCPECGQQFICPGSPSVLVVDNVVRMPAMGNYHISVVGVAHSQQVLEYFCGGRTTESASLSCEALLTPEDNNAFDRLAVRVNIGEYAIGHLSQGAARRWRSWLKRHKVASLPALCGALIVGGWYRSPIDMGHYGVRLDLPLRDSVYD